MTEATHLPKGCPTTEQLEEHLSGLAHADVDAHVEACPACLDLCAQYRAIDDAVAAVSCPSLELVERIKLACGELGPIPVRFPWWQVTRRYAAAAAVALLAFYALFVTFGGGRPPQMAEKPPPPPPSTPPPSSTAPPSALPFSTPRREADPLAAESPRSTDAIGGPLSLIGTPGTSHAQRFEPLDGTVATLVRHVWVAGDVARAEELFLQSLPEGTPCVETAAGSDVRAFTAQLTDEHLRLLVDRLAAAGLSLVSPARPQPGEGHRLALTGHSVRYDVQLVPGHTP